MSLYRQNADIGDIPPQDDFAYIAEVAACIIGAICIGAMLALGV